MATLTDANAKWAALQQKPPKMYLTDLVTLETMTAQYNPDAFEEVVHVLWARLNPPGLSHSRLQYDHTENHKIQFELIYDALDGGDVDGNLDARKFLMSLCYSKRGAQNVADGQASRVLFVWPQFVSLTCVIDGELKIKHTRFGVDGRPTYFTASMQLSEIRDARLFSEDVRSTGTQRSAAPLDPSSNGATDLSNATGSSSVLPTGNV